jgi:maleate cis-trans isomerase
MRAMVMLLEEVIMERIQEIGGIFAAKNIPSVPVGVEFLYTITAPDLEITIVHQMIQELKELMTEYKEKRGYEHKHVKCLGTFKDCLAENSDLNGIVARKSA